MGEPIVKEIADIANILEQENWELKRQVEQLTERLGHSELASEKYKGKYEALNSAYKELLNQRFSGGSVTDFYVSEEDIH
jgi:N-formylglutamate amidohydrolase